MQAEAAVQVEAAVQAEAVVEPQRARAQEPATHPQWEAQRARKAEPVGTLSMAGALHRA